MFRWNFQKWSSIILLQSNMSNFGSPAGFRRFEYRQPPEDSRSTYVRSFQLRFPPGIAVFEADCWTPNTFSTTPISTASQMTVHLYSENFGLWIVFDPPTASGRLVNIHRRVNEPRRGVALISHRDDDNNRTRIMGYLILSDHRERVRIEQCQPGHLINGRQFSDRVTSAFQFAIAVTIRRPVAHINVSRSYPGGRIQEGVISHCSFKNRTFIDIPLREQLMSVSFDRGYMSQFYRYAERNILSVDPAQFAEEFLRRSDMIDNWDQRVQRYGAIYFTDVLTWDEEFHDRAYGSMLAEVPPADLVAIPAADAAEARGNDPEAVEEQNAPGELEEGEIRDDSDSPSEQAENIESVVIPSVIEPLLNAPKELEEGEIEDDSDSPPETAESIESGVMPSGIDPFVVRPPILSPTSSTDGAQALGMAPVQLQVPFTLTESYKQQVRALEGIRPIGIRLQAEEEATEPSPSYEERQYENLLLEALQAHVDFPPKSRAEYVRLWKEVVAAHPPPAMVEEKRRGSGEANWWESGPSLNELWGIDGPGDSTEEFDDATEVFKNIHASSGWSRESPETWIQRHGRPAPEPQVLTPRSPISSPTDYTAPSGFLQRMVGTSGKNWSSPSSSTSVEVVPEAIPLTMSATSSPTTWRDIPLPRSPSSDESTDTNLARHVQSQLRVNIDRNDIERLLNTPLVPVGNVTDPVVLRECMQQVFVKFMEDRRRDQSWPEMIVSDAWKKAGEEFFKIDFAQLARATELRLAGMAGRPPSAMATESSSTLVVSVPGADSPAGSNHSEPVSGNLEIIIKSMIPPHHRNPVVILERYLLQPDGVKDDRPADKDENANVMGPLDAGETADVEDLSDTDDNAPILLRIQQLASDGLRRSRVRHSKRNPKTGRFERSFE